MALDFLNKTEAIHLNQFRSEDKIPELSAIARTSHQLSFTDFNQIDLLIDGDETYARMFHEIKNAKSYILFQFYIIREDLTGERFKNALIEKAKEGLKIYFLVDDFGSSLSHAFINELLKCGINVGIFKSGGRLRNKFQINFRNHRKLIIVDGEVLFVGGLNIGDEYLGLHKKFGYWRDTNVCIKGSATHSAQITFIKDWYWSVGEILKLKWDTPIKNKNAEVLIISTGPSDEKESALLSFLAIINHAKNKIWISNPYFIPPESLINALIMATLRGVEVCIIIPSKIDHFFVAAASKIYIHKLLEYGVKFFSYFKGFIHQKVILVDQEIACVGSMNLDSRSLYINFEITAICLDQNFILKVNDMFLEDFKECHELTLTHLNELSFWQQFLIRFSNLISPML